MGIMTTPTIGRRLAVAVAASMVGLAALVGPGIGGSNASASDGDPSTTSIAYGYDLENDPENCINFLPRPNCGREPQQAGDRGGALQFALFAVVMAALGTVGTVIVRNVVRRDRALAGRADD